MFYTIYKITNKINGKIYIGKHQTKDLNDDYMGSGKLILAAIKKYGIENFEKEILFKFNNEADMNTKEAELVTEDFVKEDGNYNLCPGGHGGFGYINSSGKNLYGMNGKTSNVSDNLKRGREKQEYLRNNDKQWSENVRLKISDGLKDWHRNNENPFKNKKHTDETKEKISVANKGNLPWNKGISHTDETKKKISESVRKTIIPNLTSNIKICKECYNKNRNNLLKIENEYWIELYYNSGIKSIRKFVKVSDYPKSHVTFSKILKN
jgi:group I intron endonuclease